MSATGPTGPTTPTASTARLAEHATRVAVIGGGAIGCVWAACLARVGAHVTVVDPALDIVNAAAGAGIVVETHDGIGAPVRVVATSDPRTQPAGDGEPVDVAFFFVKGYHTQAAAQLARPLVAAHTTVVTQQNGWGNADTLAQAYDRSQIVVGITYHSATVIAPARVRHTSVGPSYVGPYAEEAGMRRAEEVASLLRAAGLEATATAAVKTEIWKKLILNCATLAPSALTRLTAGAIGADRALLELLDGLTAEAVAVARAQGYDIDVAERQARIHAMMGAGGSGKASMLQDVEAGRRTEIETVTGAVVRAAVRAEIDVPLNRTMLALVRGLERSYLKEEAQ